MGSTGAKELEDMEEVRAPLQQQTPMTGGKSTSRWGGVISAHKHTRASLGRRRSAFFPPGFANKLETFNDPTANVTFQQGYEGLNSWQPPKGLKYETERLFKDLNAWKILRTASVKATATRGMGSRLLAFIVVAICFMLVGPACGANLQSTLESLNALIATGLIFILGPYVTLAVSRWWTVRKEGIGGLWGAVDDLCVWSAAWFYKGSLADHSARALVLRYGLLSHALLYKEARNEADQVWSPPPPSSRHMAVPRDPPSEGRVSSLISPCGLTTANPSSTPARH